MSSSSEHNESGATDAVLNWDPASTTVAPPSTPPLQPGPAPASNTSPVPTQRNPFESIDNTPIKLGSAHRSGPTTSSAKTASHSLFHQPEPAAPAPMTQAQLDINIESEMHNAIFRDPSFIDHFLAGDSSTLDAILERCRQSKAYNTSRQQWKLPVRIASEAKLYDPVLKILNAIQHSVDRAKDRQPGDNLGSSQTDQASNDPDNVPIDPNFQDWHSRAVESDEVETAGLKPDIVLFSRRELEHWETVRMSIEIKKLPTHHKAAMKQLSRYARATFAHQLHRRHLFGLTICGTEATFVLFDRAGILYSPRIDMRSQFEEFTRAFASFLLLDPTDEGYDATFDTELNEKGRLKYYVNLPVSAFENTADPIAGSSSAGQTRRFEVVDRLWHRKSIRGRATIALRLREVHVCSKSGTVETRPQKKGTMQARSQKKGTMETRSQKRERKAREEAQEKEKEAQEKAQEKEKAQAKGKRKRDEVEEPQVRNYVLKIIWRDPGRDSEGEVMEHFKGMFGLAQHVWHSDAPGQCRCTPRAKGQCWAPSCVAATARWEKMEVCDNLRDIAIPVPMDDGGIPEKGLVEVDTTQHRPASDKRKRRICSYILMSSIGVLLSAANNPAEFMNAVLDSILGYWRSFNMGVLHRDISDGNVMMLHKEGPGESGEIMGPDQRELPEEPWLAAMRTQAPLLLKSEDMLQQFLARVPRSPTGMLSDFDLHAKHTLLLPWSTTHDAWGHSAEAATGKADNRTSHPTATSSEVAPPERKRRRTNLPQDLPVSSAPPQTTSQASSARPEWESQPQDSRKEKIEFRTGTPAFMSIHVSSIPSGTPYHHSYIDDLESFFWLILWSVAAHRDGGSQHISSKAQHILNAMGTGTLETIAGLKKAHLLDCAQISGSAMKKTLQLCQNNWASDPIFTEVILGLGALFFQVGWEASRDQPPTSMFPRVVNIIMDALKIV